MFIIICHYIPLYTIICHYKSLYVIIYHYMSLYIICHAITLYVIYIYISLFSLYVIICVIIYHHISLYVIIHHISLINCIYNIITYIYILPLCVNTYNPSLSCDTFITFHHCQPPLFFFNGLQVDLEILVVIDALEERPGICGLQFLGIFAPFHHLRTVKITPVPGILGIFIIRSDCFPLKKWEYHPSRNQKSGEIPPGLRPGWLYLSRFCALPQTCKSSPSSIYLSRKVGSYKICVLLDTVNLPNFDG